MITHRVVQGVWALEEGEGGADGWAGEGVLMGGRGRGR